MKSLCQLVSCFVLVLAGAAVSSIPLVSLAVEVAPPSSERMKTLDFEAEVIEGEALRPMLYLQIEKPDLDLEESSFQRRDFNDFHRVDRGRRQKFFPAGSSGVGAP